MTTATIHIVGRDLPGRRRGEHHNIHVGVQQRRDVVDLVPGDAPIAEFTVPLEVSQDPINGVDYRGPFAQGKRGQRFVYLSWGELAADGTFAMFRRAKLNLHNLPDEVTRALAGGGAVHVELGLTDARGGPLCASIPPAQLSWTA